MKKRLRFLMVTMSLALLCLAGSVSYAQSPKTIEVGPHLGATTYAGDLNVWRNLGQWDWKGMKQFSYDFGALARYNYDSRWSFRLDYSHLCLRAGDSLAAWRPQSDLNFRTTVNDLSLMVEFNFLDYYTGKHDKAFSPYIFAGISGMMYDVQPYTGVDSLDRLHFNDLHGKVVEIDHLNHEVDVFSVDEERVGHNYALSIPFGLGCKISISEHLATTVEWRMHYTLTDYLDGVHGDYSSLKDHAIDPETGYDFTDPTGTFPEGYQRGNARTNDWFGMLNLSLTWKFVLPEKTACKMTD